MNDFRRSLLEDFAPYFWIDINNGVNGKIIKNSAYRYTTKGLLLKFEIPGIKPEFIHVKINSNVLNVKVEVDENTKETKNVDLTASFEAKKNRVAKEPSEVKLSLGVLTVFFPRIDAVEDGEKACYITVE